MLHPAPGKQIELHQGLELWSNIHCRCDDPSWIIMHAMKSENERWLCIVFTVSLKALFIFAVAECTEVYR